MQLPFKTFTKTTMKINFRDRATNCCGLCQDINTTIRLSGYRVTPHLLLTRLLTFWPWSLSIYHA